MKKFIPAFLLILSFLKVDAQIGGLNVLQFLNLPPSSRAAGLGGIQNAVFDDDITLVSQNPAILNDSMHNYLSLSFNDHVADMYYGHAAYARHYEGIATFAASITYMNYGQFIRADHLGNIEGHFYAADYDIRLSSAREFGRFSVGMALNLIYSKYEHYYSIGTALDLGTIYHSEDRLLTAALVVKNLGIQVVSYSGKESEPLPLDLQLGFTKKFEHMPFRFGIIAHHLNKPDMSYINPNEPVQTDLETGLPIEKTIPLTDKIARHFIFNTELVFGPNFLIQLGYNHQRRKEMTLPNKRGLVGFTLGARVKIVKFHIGYAYAPLHVGGPTNYFTITSNLNEFFN